MIREKGENIFLSEWQNKEKHLTDRQSSSFIKNILKWREKQCFYRRGQNFNTVKFNQVTLLFEIKYWSSKNETCDVAGTNTR